MTQIFEHTDSDGDSFEVTRYQGAESLSVTCTADTGQATVNLDKAAVRGLHEELGKWLAAQNVPDLFPETREACGTHLSEGPCAGTRRHPGDCTANADDIPTEQERSASTETRIDEADALSARILRLETDARCSAKDETRIDEAEEAITNALGAVSGVIKDEHMVDRQHYTSQFDTVVDRISDTYAMLHRQQSGFHTSATMQHMDTHEMLQGLLTEIRDRLPEPAPKVCGMTDLSGNYTCVKGLGHEGRHTDSSASWPVGIERQVCGDTNLNGGQTCVRPPDHLGYHRNVESHEDMHHAEAREWRR